MEKNQLGTDGGAKVRSLPRTTIMDQQGRVFLGETARRRAGLTGAGSVEFHLNDRGEMVLRKANAASMKKMPK